MTTKVSIVSDLHLEFHDIELPGGDILIMAGDIFLADRLRENKNDAQSRSLKKRFERFCQSELSKYQRAVHVNGNHEHYSGFIEDSAKLIKDLFAEHAPNAVQLDDESVVIDGVAFIGTTLWANYGVGTPAERHIGTGMNDFNVIRTYDFASLYGDTDTWLGRKLTPLDVSKRHKKAKRFLGKELKKYGQAGLPCIVVCHHAPSLLSNVEGFKYEDDGVDDAYYSNLHRLMKAHPHAKVWVHGHSHSSCRYRVGDTLVVSNQRGYFPSERAAREFDPAAADFDLVERA